MPLRAHVPPARASSQTFEAFCHHAALLTDRHTVQVPCTLRRNQGGSVMKKGRENV
jgi:hypothetical protein